MEEEKQFKEIEDKVKNNEINFKEAKEKFFFNKKIPMYLLEEDYEINWKNPIIKDGEGDLNDVLKKLTGTKDFELAALIFDKGRHALDGNNETRKANTMIQALADNIPNDSTEARLIAQQTTLFSQGMNYLSRAENTDMIPQMEFCLKNAMKLLRLHNETVEVLNKYRRGGEQKVIVQHVNVEGGSQAIVNNGDMIAGGGGKN